MFFIKKIVIIFAVIIFCLVISKQQETVKIPIDSIRIRIIANSNSIEDQNTKIKVKNDIEKKLYDLTEKSQSLEETRKIINDNLTNIDKTVQHTLEENSIKTDYSIKYGLNYFPSKEYKGTEYSEGNYESLVITLGSGKGDNWWCVLFPPLCLIDYQENDKNNIEYKFIVKEIIEHFM